jgi:phosphoglycolate phosphatase
MVGDTVFDIEGARNVGIDVIAVQYGYGKKEELKEADFVVKTVKDLKNLLLG